MKNTLFLLLILLPTLLNAQKSAPTFQSPQDKDRALRELKSQINLKRLSAKDRNIIKSIKEMYAQFDLDSALYYSGIELKLSIKTEDWNLIAESKLSKAKLLWKLQQPEEANQLLLENISNKKKISDSILAASYFQMAKVEMQKQRPSESVNYVLKAIPAFRAIQDSSNLADCYAHIAGVYTFVLNEPKEAISYFKKALTYAPHGDFQNLIRININYSSAYLRKRDYHQAIKCLQQAEKISNESNLKFFLPSVYVQYASVYHDFGKYTKSLEYALLADSEIKKTPGIDLVTQHKIYWYLGVSYKDLKQDRKAIDYLEKVRKSLFVDQVTLQSHLIELYARVGDFEHAFRLQEKLLAERDSSDMNLRNQQVLDVVEKYESEKKQQKIRALNAQKNRQKSQLRTQRIILYGTIAFFLVLILVGAFWYRTRTKLKETQLNLETTKLQQRFLRTQLNPHFLFHALTSIETYIYKNDKIESAKFLRSFSVLMRNILESSDVDFIPLQQDIDFITKYIELQQLNNEFKFDFEITVSPELNAKDIMIPPMLIQPAVENAILHGALSVEHGLISIEYSRVNNQLQITITDNGTARNSDQTNSNRLHRSMSLDITQTRIKNLEDVHRIKIDYTPFASVLTDQDTQVSFKLPLTI